MNSSTPPPLPAEQHPTIPEAPAGSERRVRLQHLMEMKQSGRPIVMLTAYDACFGRLADAAGADMILVGDSVGMVVHGLPDTTSVTMEMMELHTRAVTRVVKRSLVVADMPFMSYQVSVEEAVRNAGRLMQAGAHAVKLEGFSERILQSITAIVECGIPVMGHVGLVPQSVHALGGFRQQGQSEEEVEWLIQFAQKQEKAGVFAIVLEHVPQGVGDSMSAALHIPVIGIGAGQGCDGQVLVMHDVLGLSQRIPGFSKRYIDLEAATVRAFRKFGRDVRERLFPEPANES
jgi:3-methyl-2-oxobutanoate hydroxymethyltransferase